MVDLTQDATSGGKSGAPTDIYSQGIAAGFSADEIKSGVAKQGLSEDDLAKEYQKIDAAAPTQQNPPTVPQSPGPTIPPVPLPPTGAYSPEQEQQSLRAVQAIKDPEYRMKVEATLKREYANLAMADGITQKAREEGTKKAISQYTSAVKQIINDPQASWQQKQIVAKKLAETMWQDPRTDYGETREHLEGVMLGMAGVTNTKGLGQFFTEAYSAIANKQITDSRQILKMAADGQLTAAGADHLINTLGKMEKPDQATITHRQALAQQEIKNIVYFDVDETMGIKPSPKQTQKLTDVLFAFNDQILAANNDQEKIAKIASPDNVKELVERTYPRHERDVDYMSRGAPINLGGIMVPPTVPQDKQTQLAYRDIVALPPSVPDKDGKSKPMSQTSWQQAVDILRQTGNVAAFQKHYPTKDAAYILKVAPYMAPPPGLRPPPVVEPAEAEAGFWSTLGQRLFPPPGNIAKTFQFEQGNTPIGDAVKRGLNIISPLPQEAKK